MYLTMIITYNNNFQEPDEEIRKMMKKIGFTDIDVECKEMAFTYDDMHSIRSKYY